jgi:hypothetical protein
VGHPRVLLGIEGEEVADGEGASGAELLVRQLEWLAVLGAQLELDEDAVEEVELGALLEVGDDLVVVSDQFVEISADESWIVFSGLGGSVDSEKCRPMYQR